MFPIEMKHIGKIEAVGTVQVFGYSARRIDRNLCDLAYLNFAGPISGQYLDGAGRLMPGVTRLGAEEIAICPTCGTPVNSSESGQGKVSPIRWMKTQPRKCHECGGALWQLTRTFSAPGPGEKTPKRNPRYPIASLLRERYARRVAVCLVDEAHEYKIIGL